MKARSSRWPGSPILPSACNIEKPEDASIQVAGDVQIFVPLKGMVDAVAEAERLIKEIGKIDKDIELFAKKLENPAFVDRAPADVVAREREKLAEVTAKKALLEESLEKIRTLVIGVGLAA